MGELFGSYLSKFQLAAYLNIADAGIDTLLQSEELDITYTVARASYVFSCEKLNEWLEKRIS
ncbi:MAG: hypothetical protein IJA35_07695 [Clostridia bacterium]|nr:hypothetical protein [Clostridia bacterium]